MKILLTGNTGIVGSAVFRALQEAGHTLLVLGRKQPTPASTGVSFQPYDLAECKKVQDAIARFAPEAGIHTAWAAATPQMRDDAQALSLNHHASMQLLAYAQAAGCRHWISFGSHAEYAPAITEDISEDHPIAPESPYGRTKQALCAEAASFCATQGMAFSWLRLFTCYARDDQPRYIIPYLISQLRRNEMPTLHTPHAMVDLLHADDMARGVLAALSQPQHAGIYNLASGVGVSVGELALAVAEQLAFSDMAALRAQIARSSAPASRRVADVARFSARFDWRPTLSLSEGLRRCL